MIRISLPYLIELVATLDKLRTIESGPFAHHAMVFFDAEESLRGFLTNSIYAPSIRNCVESGNRLLEEIQAGIPEETDSEISFFAPARISLRLSEFRTVLMSELGVSPAYFVTPKGGYDTLTLLEAGQHLFPEALVSKVPEALFDAQEATKALAFDVCTSAGFHAYRCLESVLRRYWSHVSRGQAEPKVRSIGVYVRHMKENGIGSDRVIAALDQINKLHRNPLIHPEVALNMDETITVFGLVRGTVDLMLSELPVVPQTTTTAT